MVQKTLPMTIDQHADCPFYGGICLSNSSNLKIDTGHMNSHEHLGINAPPQDRFSYRSVLHCAPIKTEGYHVFSRFPDSNDSGIHTYYYGGDSMNTMSTNETVSFVENPQGTSLNNDFVLRFVWSVAIIQRNFCWHIGSIPLNLTMIPQLQRQDATTDIFFLSAKEMVFLQPVDDPWYSAHMPIDAIFEDASSRPLNSGFTYSKDEFMTVLACATSHQFCNPNIPAESGCLPLQGTWTPSIGDKDIAGDIWETDIQKASTRFMPNGPYSNGVGRVVEDLGAFSLLSHASSSGGLVPPLADNQWQLDVQHWFNTTMAILQRGMIEQATGPSNKLCSKIAVRPTTDAEWARCRNQVCALSPLTTNHRLGRDPLHSKTRADFCYSKTEGKKHGAHVLQRPRPLSNAIHRDPHHCHIVRHRTAHHFHPEVQEHASVPTHRVDHEQISPAATTCPRGARLRHLAQRGRRRPHHQSGREAGTVRSDRPRASDARGARR